MTARRVPVALVPVLLLVAALVACTAPAGSGTAGPRGWFSPGGPAPCVPSLLDPTGTGPGGSGSPAVPAPVPDRLPDLTLTCLDSPQAVPLRALGRPVILNLWASWCQPCRAEMPVLAAYADGHPGQLTVIGVDTGDTPDAALPQLAARGVGYPVLADEHRTLLAALGRAVLPVTVFAAADGTIRYIHDTGVLDAPRLAQLAHTYLGIAP